MKDIKKYGKKSMTALLSSAMVLTLPGVNELKVQAASVINMDDNSIVYSVDCGDIDVTTVPEDGPLGTHNSVTDQVYGADKKTGYKWGVVDTVSSPLVNGSSSAGGVTPLTGHGHMNLQAVTRLQRQAQTVIQKINMKKIQTTERES